MLLVDLNQSLSVFHLGMSLRLCVLRGFTADAGTPLNPNLIHQDQIYSVI
jgi:hypothetical protein